MITAYALLRQACGLSIQEAACHHKVSTDTVKSWSAGRNPASSDAVAELRALYARIARAAREGARQIEISNADRTELALARSDAEAQRLGWPCVGAQAAALAITIALTDKPVSIVSRGATDVTRAAASPRR